jgi:hypothetical protein
MVLLKIIYTNFIKITFKIFLLDNKELKNSILAQKEFNN